MAINKVVYGDQTLIDLTDSTLESSDELVSGVSAYSRSGNLLTGTADYMDKVSNPTSNDVLVTDSNGQAIDSGVQIDDLAPKSDYVAKSGDTMTGALDIANNAQLKMTTNTDFSVTPSSNFYSQGIRFFDVNDDMYAVTQIANWTNGTKGLSLGASREVGGSLVYNGLRLGLDASGNTTVQLVGTNAPSSWRTALGAQATLTAGTGIDISSNVITNTIFNGELNSKTGSINDILDGGVYRVTSATDTPLGAVGLLVVFEYGQGWVKQMWFYLGTNITNTSRAFTRTIRKISTGISVNSGWIEMVRPYIADDVFTTGSNYVNCTGFVATDGTFIRFYLPLPKPIEATGVTVTSLTVNAMGATGLIMNGINVLTNTGYSVSTYIDTSKSGVAFTINATTAFASGARARPCTVQLRPLSITFS